MKTKGAITVLVVTLLTTAPTFGAPYVTSGFQPDAVDYGAVRWRNFAGFAGDKEIRIGTIPLTPGGTFNTGDYLWVSGGSTPVKFRYDASSSTLTTDIGSAPVTVTYILSAAPGDTVNYMRVDLCNSNQSAVSLNSVTLDGESVASFGYPTGCQAWSVIDIDKSGGFELEAAIEFISYQSGMDQSLIQVRFGHYAPSVSGAPAVSNVLLSPDPLLLNGPASVTATVDDTGETRGNNPIAGAEYRLNGGSWFAMEALDGAFDEVAEEVKADFTATKAGANEACVRGRDTLGNTSDPQCQTFTADYAFEGFFSPVDNGRLNVASGCKSIPVKWRLTDHNGKPVSNPASFAGLWSYPIDCAETSGQPTDSIESYSSGSALQYKGDGKWQFIWKTSKSYAKKCYAMYVLFDTGVASPVATFKFK
jgi:hypothetical protein